MLASRWIHPKRFIHRSIPMALPVVLLAVSSCLAREVETPSLPDLTGQWAMVQVMPAIAELPFLGSTMLVTTVYALVDVVQTGAEVVMQDAYCFTDVEMKPPHIESEVPERFMRSLAPAPRLATLEIQEREVLFTQDWVTEVRGARLENPESDPLPVGTYDSRVYDQDGDSHPGLTIPVTALGLVSGDTYVVHRLRYRLAGAVIDSHTILGTMEWSSEQNVLSATDAILMMNYTFRLDPDLSKHRFVMQRIDGSPTCEMLRAVSHELLDLLSAPLPPCAMAR